VTGSHTPLAVLNRVVNPFVRAVLRSPAHVLLSGRLALLTVTGRRSGRAFTFPVGYHRDGERVTIDVGSPERKRWWRNLSDPAPVEIRLEGVRHGGTGHAHGDERAGVTVELQLDGLDAAATAT
jgi:F420H(2)-dependent quinone reductase